MNYKRVEKLSEIKLEGITVELERHNDSLRGLVLTDSKGGRLKVHADYGMSALVPEPPKIVKRWQVHGKLAGVEIMPQVFERESDALSFVADKPDADLAVTELTVEELQ